MLHRLEAEEARHAHHGGAAVEQLLLLGEGAHGAGLGVGLVGDERAEDDHGDGEDHGRGRVRELLRDGLAGGDLRAGSGDEGHHGEAAVHQLGAGHGAAHVPLGGGERERLLDGVVDGGVRGGAGGPAGEHAGDGGRAIGLVRLASRDVLRLGAALRLAVLIGEEHDGLLPDGLVGGEPASLGDDRAARGSRRGRGDAGGEGGGDGEGGHVCECGCDARARRFVVKSASLGETVDVEACGCRNCHE